MLGRFRTMVRDAFRPDQRDIELSQFMSDELYERIKQFPIVMIMPPYERNGSTEEESFFARGLCFQLIRNLMLVRNMSVQSPGDTKMWPREDAVEAVDDGGADFFVSGCVKIGSSFRATFDLHEPEKSPRHIDVHKQDFAEFVRACTESLASALGAEINELTEKGWNCGQATLPETLIGFGRSIRRETSRTANALRNLWENDTSFSPVVTRVEDGNRAKRLLFLDAMQQDPFNAELYWKMGLASYGDEDGFDQVVFGYYKRAVELSPGNGKAHMFLGFSGHEDADMLRHSELAYVLMPTNAFAIENLINRLNRDKLGRGTPEMLEYLCRRAIEVDPENPGGYQKLIDLYISLGQFEHAVEVAEHMQELFEPTISSRTQYSLEQSGYFAQKLDAGWDPAEDNKRRIAGLRALVDGQTDETQIDIETLRASY